MPVFSSDEFKILFIHVPKTGGSTIEHFFYKSEFKVLYRDPSSALLNKGSLNRIRKCSPQHMHAEMLTTVFDIDKFDYVFTLVRDPISRFKSEYAMRNSQNFDVSPEAVYQWLQTTLLHYNSNQFIYDNHIRPQAEFIVPGTHVFKLEDGIDIVFDTLRDVLSIDIEYDSTIRAMDRFKQNGFLSSDAEVNDKSLMLLRTFYEKDFRVFGY